MGQLDTVQLMGPFWKSKLQVLSLWHWEELVDLKKYDPDVPSQRSKELVPSHARRQDKVFHGENMSRGEIANDGSQT